MVLKSMTGSCYLSASLLPADKIFQQEGVLKYGYLITCPDFTAR
jgi:hypothetical protein